MLSNFENMWFKVDGLFIDLYLSAKESNASAHSYFGVYG